ncbi:plasmid mobilization protein [Foetidibacter luteolus]|uniref:plasmid mobilization protein n=1 Tax=Foetidibacter luteolus TaxID=2608880 RepID=UPI001F387F7A|nr:plasmid mobilization relaxosome protein MobC [Foetidibacter luteolus]
MDGCTTDASEIACCTTIGQMYRCGHKVGLTESGRPSSEVGGGHFGDSFFSVNYLFKCENETVMKDKKENKDIIFKIRFTATELDKIKAAFARTTCRNLTDYIRKLLLQKPVVTTTRNRSLDDFMTELVRLRNELNAIGANYNQMVKRLHSLQHIPEIKTWAVINESARQILTGKVEEIKTKIAQINDQWLQ